MSTCDAARALVDRLLGPAAATVQVDLVPGDCSTYTIGASRGDLQITATDGVAVASALRLHLADEYQRELTPGVTPAGLPARWRDRESLTRSSPWRWRYHLNFCTFGYSTAYWDWSRWQQEIDRMAMRGINLPLATVGFEGAWLRVLTELGLSSERARQYLGSAAYLPWTWMGCVHDHGSPMSEREIETRVDLGRRILERQRALGMTPVLPGFSGYLPRELAGPDARPVDWMGFANHCVDPGDPIYREFGLALLAAQRELFGSDGFFAVDPFIEGRPPVDDPAEVAQFAGAIADVLTEHDPDSVWVLQAWPFSYQVDYWDHDRTSAFLGAMPAHRSLVLDLWAEHDPMWRQTSGFADREWIWTVLHSFGGRPGLYGALDVVATAADDALAERAGRNLVGIGTAMEALGSDPVLYDLVADVAWFGRVDDLHAWLRLRVSRRYGEEHWRLVSAWAELFRLCYRNGALPGPPVSVVMCRPRLEGDLSPVRPMNLTVEPGSVGDLLGLTAAWQLMIESAHRHGATPELESDIVEVGLDILGRLAGTLQQRAVAEFRSGDRDALEQSGAAFTDVVAAIDELAGTSPERRLDTWLRSARSWGETDRRADDLERDAKRLVTSWVEPGHVLEDYAGKHWSGLAADYYLPRWQRWFAALLAAPTPDDLEPERFEERLSAFEREWLDTPYRPTQAPQAGLRSAVAVAAEAAALVRQVLRDP